MPIAREVASSESNHSSGEYLRKAGVAQPLQCCGVGHKEDVDVTIH